MGKFDAAKIPETDIEHMVKLVLYENERSHALVNLRSPETLELFLRAVWSFRRTEPQQGPFLAIPPC